MLSPVKKEEGYSASIRPGAEPEPQQQLRQQAVQQQPCQLKQQLSGNPFSVGVEASGTELANMLAPFSSSAQNAVSGNPFKEAAGFSGFGGVNQEGVAGQEGSAPGDREQGASSSASPGVGKDAEMSPLQNGLIRSAGVPASD